MKKALVTACMMLILGVAPTHAMAWAEEGSGLDGVWRVSVTVRTCDTGDLIRNVRAMNLFIHDGSMTETAASALRSSSVGTWRHLQDRTYEATFRFFRYTPDGGFASTAKVMRTITLSDDGRRFTSQGKVEDFDGGGASISVGCSTETAIRVD